jgi:hypothetical protein
MIIAYDLDGVLCVKPEASPKKWGMMKKAERDERKRSLLEHYSKADRLLNPDCRFHVITARKNDELTRSATEMWLKHHFGDRIISVSMLNESRTVENVVKHKSDAIRMLGVEEFTEDNKAVLKGIRKLNPTIRLYFWEQGMPSRVLFQ